MDPYTLGFFSFCGGLIDAAVGGGGLVLERVHDLSEMS